MTTEARLARLETTCRRQRAALLTLAALTGLFTLTAQAGDNGAAGVPRDLTVRSLRVQGEDGESIYLGTKPGGGSVGIDLHSGAAFAKLFVTSDAGGAWVVDDGRGTKLLATTVGAEPQIGIIAERPERSVRLGVPRDSAGVRAEVGGHIALLSAVPTDASLLLDGATGASVFLLAAADQAAVSAIHGQDAAVIMAKPGLHIGATVFNGGRTIWAAP